MLNAMGKFKRGKNGGRSGRHWEGAWRGPGAFQLGRPGARLKWKYSGGQSRREPRALSISSCGTLVAGSGWIKTPIARKKEAIDGI